MTLTALERRKLRAMVATCDHMLVGLVKRTAMREASEAFGFTQRTLEEWTYPAAQHDPYNRAFVKALAALSENPRDVKKIMHAIGALMSLSDVELRRVSRATPGVPPRASNPRGVGEARERSDPPVTGTLNETGVEVNEGGFLLNDGSPVVKVSARECDYPPMTSPVFSPGDEVVWNARTGEYRGVEVEVGVGTLPGGRVAYHRVRFPWGEAWAVPADELSVVGVEGSSPVHPAKPARGVSREGTVATVGGPAPDRVTTGAPGVGLEGPPRGDEVRPGEVERGEVVPFAGLLPRRSMAGPVPGEEVSNFARSLELGATPGWPWSAPETADPRVVALWDSCGGWRPPRGGKEARARGAEKLRGPRLLKPATWGAWLRGEVGGGAT